MTKNLAGRVLATEIQRRWEGARLPDAQFHRIIDRLHDSSKLDDTLARIESGDQLIVNVPDVLACMMCFERISTSMTTTIEVEQRTADALLERARARGLTLDQYLRVILQEEPFQPQTSVARARLSPLELDRLLDELASAATNAAPLPEGFSREDIYFDTIDHGVPRRHWRRRRSRAAGVRPWPLPEAVACSLIPTGPTQFGDRFTNCIILPYSTWRRYSHRPLKLLCRWV